MLEEQAYHSAKEASRSRDSEGRVSGLGQICDRLDKNFYRYLSIREDIGKLSRDCLKKRSVKKRIK
jgi:hypothetical protein